MERKNFSLISKKSSASSRSEIHAEIVRESRAVLVRSRHRVPRSLNETPFFTKTFRFRRNITGTATVTLDCLANLWFVAHGSTSASRLCSTLRLAKIEAWSNTSPNTGSVDGMQPIQIQLWDSIPDRVPAAPPQTFSDAGSFDKPGHICVRPGVLTSIGSTFNAFQQRVTVFTFSGQEGDVIDVTLEYSWIDVVAQGIISLVSASTTSGGLYYNSHLDNTNTSGLAGARMLDSMTAFPQAVALG